MWIDKEQVLHTCKLDVSSPECLLDLDEHRCQACATKDNYRAKVRHTLFHSIRAEGR